MTAHTTMPKLRTTRVNGNRADKIVGTSLLSSPKLAKTELRHRSIRIRSVKGVWKTYDCRMMVLRETGGRRSTSARAVRLRYVDS